MVRRKATNREILEQFYNWLNAEAAVFGDECIERGLDNFSVHATVTGDRYINVPNGDYAPLLQQKVCEVQFNALVLKPDFTHHYGRDDNMEYECEILRRARPAHQHDPSVRLIK